MLHYAHVIVTPASVSWWSHQTCIFFFLPAGYLLYEFTQFWQAEEPRDIMEFSRVREKFRKKVKQALKETDVRLLPKFQETLDS